MSNTIYRQTETTVYSMKWVNDEGFGVVKVYHIDELDCRPTRETYYETKAKFESAVKRVSNKTEPRATFK